MALVKEDVRKLVRGAGGMRRVLRLLRQAGEGLPHPAAPQTGRAAALQVVSGELSDALLDQLSALSTEVFLPLIASNNAPKAAPAAAIKGVAEGMHKFVASGAWAWGARERASRRWLPLLLHGAGWQQLVTTAPCLCNWVLTRAAKLDAPPVPQCTSRRAS